jgi:modulator of FtsH protease
MSDPVVVQEWQPFFMTLAGASAALAGLVFVAMSLHPRPILSHPIMRARALGTAFGFLLGVAWALILLMPARTAPVGSWLLVAVGGGESLFIGVRQIQLRTAGVCVALVVLGDLLLPAPLLAGIVGLLQPHSAFPYILLAIAAGMALFLLFFQSWTLVLHSVLSADEAQRPAPRQGTHDHSLDGDHPTMNASTTSSAEAGSA